MGLGRALDVSSSLYAWSRAHLKVAFRGELGVLLNSVAHHSEISTRERGRCCRKGKLSLIRMPAVWADGSLTVLQKLVPKFCSAMKVFKGKGKSSHLIMEMGGSVSFPLLTACKLADFVILPEPLTLFTVYS